MTAAERAQAARRHAELAAAATTCPAGDSWCPCQDGDGAACHHDTHLGPPLWALLLEEVDA